MGERKAFDPEVEKLVSETYPQFNQDAKDDGEPIGSFDEALFGMLLRKLRTDNGYKTAEDLSKALKAKTGLSITPQTLYRIEKGTRSITYPEFLAYSLLFFGEFDSDQMHRFVALSAPPAWTDIDEQTKNERFQRQLDYCI